VGQDAGSARLAGNAPRAVSVGAASHRPDQRDSQLPAGTRYYLRGPARPPASSDEYDPDRRLQSTVEMTRGELSQCWLFNA
jgi:hypothetical protein